MVQRFKKTLLAMFILTTAFTIPDLSFGEEPPNIQGRYGVGIQSNILNFGLAPTAEYWITDNIGASASLTLIGDFKGYGLRGLYLFDKEFSLWGRTTKPYAGLGYASVEGPEEKFGIFGTVSSKTKGSGFELFGGIEQTNLWGYENIALGLEFALNTITLKDTIEIQIPEGCTPGPPQPFTIPCIRDTQTVESDYGSFTLGVKLIYYFPQRYPLNIKK